jgi:predicted NBD/HSP70 family sugar kinase
MLIKADGELVRRQNRGLVLETLRERGPLARITLGQVTGLSPASITSITGQLIDEGFVQVLDEEPEAQGKRGRPLTRLGLNPHAATVIAVMISVDGVELVFADFRGVMRAPVKLPIDTFQVETQAFGPLIAEGIRQQAERLGIAMDSVRRIGVAVQGVADTDTGEISWSPAFRGGKIPVVEPLMRELNVPCTIANNANMIAEALLSLDRSRYGGTTAVVYLGHGIGLGLILNGAVFSGASGRAAEFGHMNHDPNGPLCRCGRRGCIEAFAADYGIARAAQGARPDFDVHAPVEARVMATLQAAAEGGDEVARRAFAGAGTALGFGMGRLISIINPARIVIVGPGTRAYHLMAAAAQDGLEKSLVQDLRERVEFEIASLDKDMMVTGTLLDTLRHLDRETFAAGYRNSDSEQPKRRSA